MIVIFEENKVIKLILGILFVLRKRFIYYINSEDRLRLYILLFIK